VILYLLGCVPKYQRYVEGIYKGSNPSDLLTLLDDLVKGNKFIFKTSTVKSREYTLIAVYNRYDDNIQQDIELIVFLKEFKEGNGRTEFLITVNALGREKSTKSAVNRDFETLVSGIESRLEPSKLKILKKS
jgi:hypothetical protein